MHNILVYTNRMGEIVEIGAWKAKRNKEEAPTSRKEELPDLHASNDDPQESERKARTARFIAKIESVAWEDFMRIVKTARNSAIVSPSLISEQRVIVDTWSDDQIVEFLENGENRQALKSKPALAMALLGRILGK